VPQDLIPFLVGIGLLILYLFWSAATEMGTKLPWKKNSSSNKLDR